MIEPDLNLLRIFEMLDEERSVTRAAERLGLTQSAVSHALRRLRQALGDPLFIRAPGGLQPTARALQIAPRLRDGLSRVRTALTGDAYDPATATRRFNIAAGAYICALLTPALVARMRREAPHSSLRIWNLMPDLLPELDAQRIDLAFTGNGHLPARVCWQGLIAEDIVWIAARDNPLARAPVDQAALNAAPRVTLAGSNILGDGLGAAFSFDPMAAEAAPKLPVARSVTAVVYDVATAVAIVARTDAVSLIPRRFAQWNADRVTIVPLPQDVAKIEVGLAWHRSANEDAGLAWLRALVIDTFAREMRPGDQPPG